MKILWIVFAVCAAQLTSGDVLDDMKTSALDLTNNVKVEITNAIDDLGRGFLNEMELLRVMPGYVGSYIVVFNYTKLYFPNLDDETMKPCLYNFDSFKGFFPLAIDIEHQVVDFNYTQSKLMYELALDYYKLEGDVIMLENDTNDDFEACGETDDATVEACCLDVLNTVDARVNEFLQEVSDMRQRDADMFFETGKKLRSMLDALNVRWRSLLDDVLLCLQNNQKNQTAPPVETTSSPGL